MRYYIGNSFYGDDFYHYGVKNQKHGVRRYQNPDGSLTPEGYVHYGRKMPSKKGLFGISKARKSKKSSSSSKLGQKVNKVARPWKNMTEDELKAKTARLKLENEYLDAKKKQRELRQRNKKIKEKGQHTVLNIFKDFGLAFMNNKMNDASKRGLKYIETFSNERVANINAKSNENIAYTYASRGLVGPANGGGGGGKKNKNGGGNP